MTLETPNNAAQTEIAAATRAAFLIVVLLRMERG
jgi:hypothetical protein